VLVMFCPLVTTAKVPSLGSCIDWTGGGVDCEDLHMSQPDRYLLGDSAAELEHLVAQAAVYADEARQLLDRVPLADGSAVLDVGCGVLGVLDLLRERVGPTGRVVGVDREPRMVAAARGLAEQRGLTVEVIEDD